MRDFAYETTLRKRPRVMQISRKDTICTSEIHLLDSSNARVTSPACHQEQAVFSKMILNYLFVFRYPQFAIDIIAG